MAPCNPACEPDLTSTSVDPDGRKVRNLYVSADETVLCYATDSEIQKWDLTGISPSFDSQLTISGLVPILTSVGTVLFVASSDGTRLTIRAIDTTTSPPSSLGTLTLDPNGGTTPSTPNSLAASGNRLYVIDTTLALAALVRTIDISNPASMSVLDDNSPSNLETTTNGGVRNPVILLADPADGNILYAGGNRPDGGTNVTVFDMTDPTAAGIVEVGHYTVSTGSSPRLGSLDTAIAYKDGLLFISGARSSPNTKRLFIIDVSTPSAPSLASDTLLDGDRDIPFGIFPIDDNLYLNNDLSLIGSGPYTGDGQLEVWNVSDPTAPVQCKALLLTGTPSTPGIFVGPSGNCYQAIEDGSESGSFLIYDVASCGDGAPPPSPSSQYLACRALGSSGNHLLVADNSGSALRIYNTTNPTTPTLIATLALDEAPTDLALIDSLVFVAAPPALYVISIDEIDGPELLIEGVTDGEMITATGRQIYTSGPSAGIKVYKLKPDESEIERIDKLHALNTGIGRVAFGDRRVYFADLAGSECKLRSYSLGGFSCHHIEAGELYAETIDGEIVRVRHLLAKGEIVAHGLTIAGSGNGSFSGDVVIHGNLTVGGTLDVQEEE